MGRCRQALCGEELEERRIFLPASPDERWSNRQYGPGAKPRFHYRYAAAQLAWEAASLLQGYDDLAASILCTGGTWLKTSDAQAANRFYQALLSWHPKRPLAKRRKSNAGFPE